MEAFIDYKYEIVKELIKSQSILSLLLDTPNIDISSIDDSEIDKRIHTYNFVPEVSTDATNYIVIGTNVSKIQNNKVLSIDTTITVLIPYSKMKLPSTFLLKGNRLDNIVTLIISMFNGERKFGFGKIDLLPNRHVYYVKGFGAFEINFRTTDINT